MRWLIDFIKSLLGICETRPLGTDFWTMEDGSVHVKLSEMPDLCEKGKGVYLKGQGLHKPVLIVRTDDDQYLAYTNRCTHFGHRKLDPVPGPEPGQPVLRCCSVNHSTFDFEGNRLTGPAKENLVQHEVELSSGDLVIKIAEQCAEAEDQKEAVESATEA